MKESKWLIVLLLLVGLGFGSTASAQNDVLPTHAVPTVAPIDVELMPSLAIREGCRYAAFADYRAGEVVRLEFFNSTVTPRDGLRINPPGMTGVLAVVALHPKGRGAL